MSRGFTERKIYVVSFVPTISDGPSMNLTKQCLVVMPYRA